MIYFLEKCINRIGGLFEISKFLSMLGLIAINLQYCRKRLNFSFQEI